MRVITNWDYPVGRYQYSKLHTYSPFCYQTGSVSNIDLTLDFSGLKRSMQASSIRKRRKLMQFEIPVSPHSLFTLRMLDWRYEREVVFKCWYILDTPILEFHYILSDVSRVFLTWNRVFRTCVKMLRATVAYRFSWRRAENEIPIRKYITSNCCRTKRTSVF